MLTAKNNLKIIELDLMDLLNQNLDKLQQFIDDLKNDIRQIKHYKYVNFYEEGISFCLVNDKIESIYIYNQNIMKFNRYFFSLLNQEI